MTHWLDWAYDLIVAGLPTYTAIREGQSNIVPSVDFIGYAPVSLDTSSFGFYTDGALYADPDDAQTLGTFNRSHQQNCPLVMQFRACSANALLDLQALCSFAHSSEALAILDASHIAFRGCGTIRDAKFLDDTGYKPSAIADLNFEIALTRIEALNAILYMRASGIYTGSAGSIASTIHCDLDE